MTNFPNYFYLSLISIYLLSHRVLPLEMQGPFPLSCHFSKKFSLSEDAI
jgi:hypothetical protein